MLRLKRYERISIENRRFCSNEVSLAQNFTYKGSSHTDRSSCQKTRVNDLSCGIRVWAEVSFVLSQSTRLIDGRTEGQTDGHFADGYTVRCITCSRMVKSNVRHFRRGNVLLKLLWCWRPIISTSSKCIFNF